MKYLLILLINLISISELYSQWHLKTTLNNNPPVVSVKTVDENVAWITGFDGTVYRTIDGGETWNATLTKASTTESLGPIEALDENTAFVGGAGPDWSGGNTKIYRTTNGGQSWDSVYTAVGETSFWNWIHFFDSQNGIAQSDPSDGDTFLIVKTTDGGTTWSPISNLPAANSNEFGLLNSFFFYDDLNGWFGTGHPPFVPGGNAGRVFRTTDGGNTWTPFASGNGEDANAMEFISPLIGIRTSVTSPFLTRTTDGGQTWTAADNLPLSNIQQIIDAASVNTENINQIWISGIADDDFILTSIDGGLTWHEQIISNSPIDPIWHTSAVSFGASNDSVRAFAITFNLNTFASGGQIFNYSQPLGFLSPGFSVFTSGLSSPIGLELDVNGNLWVAEEGTGNDDSQISIITPDGEVYPFLIGLPSMIIEGDPQGASNIYFDNNGNLLIVQGDGVDSLSQSILVVDPSGFVPGSQPLEREDIQDVYNIGQFVLGQGAVSSNPYSLTVGPNNDLFIVDAGFNGVVRRESSTGNLSTFATFDPIPNPTTVGPPLIDAVPTGIVFNGTHFYVGAFTGFPFLSGISQIYEIDLNGNISVFKDSLTSIVDIAIDPRDNNLMALEYGVFDLTAGFLLGTGNVLKLANETVDTLFKGLSLPTGLQPASNGDLFVSIFRDGKILKLDASVTGVDFTANGSIPESFGLDQNYPNPFNPLTNIQFRTTSREFITLKIFDILGREVKTLVNEELNAGNYSVEWNAADYSSGIYFYTLQTGEFIQTRKMVLIK